MPICTRIREPDHTYSKVAYIQSVPRCMIGSLRWVPSLECICCRSIIHDQNLKTKRLGSFANTCAWHKEMTSNLHRLYYSIGLSVDRKGKDNQGPLRRSKWRRELSLFETSGPHNRASKAANRDVVSYSKTVCT